MRKLQHFDSATVFYRQAHNLLSKGHESAFSELLRELALDAINSNDLPRFRRTIAELENIDSTRRSPRTNIDRLYGYYYYTAKNPQASIRHYKASLAVFEKQYEREVVQIGEAFYALTEQLMSLKKYNEAEHFCLSAFVQGGPQSEGDNWNIVIHPRRLPPNGFVAYGILAEVYAARYKDDKRKIDDIQKALRIYQITDSLMVKQLRATDEDAIIEYLSYVGHRAYSGGIEASFLLFEQSRDPVYVAHAHQFMEKSKSLIMYRDMLARFSNYFRPVLTA
jgi:tetratricopeptide (TPR) repeat protein